MSSDQNSLKLSRILAIDYGKRRIGLALCDPMKTFAYPFTTLLNKENIIDELKKIVVEQEVDKVILGMPVRSEGKTSIMTEPILAFKKELEQKILLPVILVDESFSSSIAQERILASVPKKSKRKEKGLVDRNAAAVILQEYLDEGEQ